MNDAPSRAVRGHAQYHAHWWIACLFWWMAGCLPFFRSKPEPQRTPAMVQRFANETAALGVAPSPPRLADVTRTLARAVQALPWTPSALDLGQKIDDEGKAMEAGGPQQEVEHARQSLRLALQAIDGMKKPAGSKAERERSMELARAKVGDLDGSSPAAARPKVESAYRAVAHTLVVVTGGGGRAGGGGRPAALVARFATEEVDLARRTGAQVLYAMATAIDGLPTASRKAKQLAEELRSRTERLTDTDALDYSARLKEALQIAADALSEVAKTQRSSALEQLCRQVRPAVDSVSSERPFELQRPVVQDAFRLLADALTVASAG